MRVALNNARRIQLILSNRHSSPVRSFARTCEKLKRCSGSMDNITDVVVQPLQRGSRFVVPVCISYTQDGTKKTWEAVRAGGSVSCVIFNTSRQKLICVRQFRPGVYINGADASDWEKEDEGKIDTRKNPPGIGITLELCGGIIDKPLSLEQICAEEVLEETGYEVSASAMTKIGTCRAAVGIAGEPQVIYYVEVTDEMRKSAGGGIDDEMIEVVELGVDEVKKLMSEDSLIAPPEFFWGVTWFLLNKANK